jgi:Methylamine utilisation protein MauE
MTWLAQAQPLFLAGVFGWSGTSKTLGGDPGGRVAGTALHRLLGGRLAPPAYFLLGVAEIALAVSLAVEPGRPSALAAAVLSGGFLVYLGYAAVATPQASCGCLGKRKVRQSWRGFARAGLLMAAAMAAGIGAPAPEWWHRPPLAEMVQLLLAETALFITLSAELDTLWLYPLWRLRVRIRRPLAGAPDEVPLQATVRTLIRSAAWREASHLVASDILEHWDADGHRILVYNARTPEGGATALFAVPLAGDADAIRFTLVDDQEVVAAG